MVPAYGGVRCQGATVRMLSRIGRPVDRPVAVEVEVAGWDDAARRLIDGAYELV